MEGIERKKTITYRWWRPGLYEKIIPAHVPALEENAENRIGEMMAQGHTSGDLSDNIVMTDDDPEDGVEYRGWWKVEITS